MVKFKRLYVSQIDSCWYCPNLSRANIEQHTSGGKLISEYIFTCFATNNRYEGTVIGEPPIPDDCPLEEIAIVDTKLANT